jgi:hypothetical protein
MLLGIGEAGHIGLNEPLSAPMSRTQSVLVVQAAMPVAIFPIVVTRGPSRRHADRPSGGAGNLSHGADRHPSLDRTWNALDPPRPVK